MCRRMSATVKGSFIWMGAGGYRNIILVTLCVHFLALINLLQVPQWELLPAENGMFQPHQERWPLHQMLTVYFWQPSGLIESIGQKNHLQHVVPSHLDLSLETVSLKEKMQRLLKTTVKDQVLLSFGRNYGKYSRYVSCSPSFICHQCFHEFRGEKSRKWDSSFVWFSMWLAHRLR